MDTMRPSDVLWVVVAAFAGFELALAANYLLLKLVLHAMQFSLRPTSKFNVQSQSQKPLRPDFEL